MLLLFTPPAELSKLTVSSQYYLKPCECRYCFGWCLRRSQHRPLVCRPWGVSSKAWRRLMSVKSCHSSTWGWKRMTVPPGLTSLRGQPGSSAHAREDVSKKRPSTPIHIFLKRIISSFYSAHDQSSGPFRSALFLSQPWFTYFSSMVAPKITPEVIR